MTLDHFLARHRQVVHVLLGQVRGSSPRDAGAEMFVAASAVHGTIGGGQLEYMAIDKARVMLRGTDDVARMDVPLGPEIGQCCGGRVTLDLTRMTPADRAAALAAEAETRAARPHVYVLGAGHVGRALARLFQFMPLRCVLIDNREAELALADAEVEKRLSPIPESEIRNAPPGAAFIVLTHDHALDFLLTSEALGRGDAAYVGLIGSATKRAKFAQFHAEHAMRSDTANLICPIGATASADKRPEVIAAFVVAEVMAALSIAADQRADPQSTA